MRYPLLSFFALVALAGCSSGDSTEPTSPALLSPAFVIADGAHTGNRDFFFLPPMVADPSGNAHYEAGAFNPDLKPVITICAVAASGLNTVSTTLCSANPLVVTVSAQDDQYHYNWSVPTSSSDVYYRIAVTIGNNTLGVAEVVTAESEQLLKNVNASQFVAVKDGRTLPVKFRIEKYALCSTPGVGPCSSETINFSTGGEVTTQLGGNPAGVTIPSQTNNFTTTITAEACETLNPRATDLPVFGPCLSITANPALSAGALANAATVFICSVTSSLAGMSDEQKERVTLHRFDAPSTLAALPHANACAPPAVSASIKGVFRDLAHGAFKSAGGQIVSLMLPKPLYAAPRRLDVGAGGFTDDFSGFQFAIPAKLEILAGNGQVGVAGSLLPIAPKVRVTDLAGDAVPGARVRFANDAAICAGLAAGAGTNSDANGEVSDAPWAVSAGANTRAACGRGLAGNDFDGPRATFDPFQPLSTHFLDAVNGSFVPVLTGSVLFNATGVTITLPSTLAGFGSGGYTSYAPAASSVNAPLGWPNPAPGANAIVGSQSPFRGTSGVCAITNVGGTTFPGGQDIFVSKSVIAPVGGTLDVTIRIDNDVRIWVDGVEKTSLLTPSATLVSGFWPHEGCADVNPALGSFAVGAGTHTISLWARDRGVVGYLDMKVVLR